MRTRVAYRPGVDFLLILFILIVLSVMIVIVV